jgi:glycosyltransferase involved in cell wall biosynthesis
MDEFVAPFSAWPPRNRAIRPAWAAASLASRLPGIAASFRYDLTFLQREMLSTFRTLEPLTKRPRVLDLDDAVWIGHESRIRTLVQAVDGVVCGNAFIDSWVAQWNANRITIPTAVDTDRWHPRHRDVAPRDGVAQHRILGWSGLHAGAKYLLGIESALAQLLRLYPDVTLRIVSDRRPEFLSLPPHRVEYIPWSPSNEVTTIQEMTVGIMPLDDTPWERGKCSYKMLLYMACGVPVVVSPIGMNGDVLQRGRVGLPAMAPDEWVHAVSAILDDQQMAHEMGLAGRQVVLQNFALPRLGDDLARYFRTLAS